MGNIKSLIQNFNAKRELKKYAGKINMPELDEPVKIIDLVFNQYERFFWIKQVRSEFMNLARVLKTRKPNSVLEIGTAGGGSLFAFTKLSTPNAKIISIDLPHGKFGGGYPKYRETFYKSFINSNQNLYLLRGDSHSKVIRDQASEIIKGNLLDFLFIDGDHTFEGVKNDFEYYSKMVSKKGIIALHDIAIHSSTSECKVHQYWEQLKARFWHIELIEDRNQQWAGIGLIFKDAETFRQAKSAIT